jgi:putative transposase
MKRVSPYLKMRVLGAIEFAPGNSIAARIKHVAQNRFLDEDGNHRQFTWRTIQTWYTRYKKHGVTTMQPKPRGDKGTFRKVEPEKLQEAIEQVLPAFRADRRRLTIAAVYRECIERNLLRRDEVAPNTFRRIVDTFGLLQPETQSKDKRRLAFAKAHANELWQVSRLG